MIANPFQTPAQILEGVAAIALQIQQAVALEAGLQTALDATRELLQTDRALLYQFLPTGDGVIMAESVSPDCMTSSGPLCDAPYLSRDWVERYQQGYTNAIDTITVDTRNTNSSKAQTRLLPLQKQATLVAPILIQGALQGLLITHHGQRLHAWQPLEVQCLQMVALQLGVAIQLETRSQERLLGAIAANLPGAIYRAVYSAAGRLSSIFFSDSYRTLLGYDPHVLMAHPERVLELIHPDDQAHFFEALAIASKTLHAGYLEYRLITASGDALWVRDHASFSRSNQGELIVDGMHLDISDRKRSEDALRQSEARKSALISALPDLIMRVDQAGYYLEFLATPTFNVVGEMGEFVGTSVYDSLPFELAERRMHAIRTAWQTHSIQFYEHAMLIDGEIQTEEVRVVPYRADEVLLVVRDITDRKQAEAALRENEERSRLAFEAAHMGSWDWNITTNEIVWSESLERLMGMQPGTFNGRLETLIAMIYPDDRERVATSITRSVEEGDAYDLEFRFVKFDGSIRWAVSKGKVLRDTAGVPVRMLGVDVDVTDRKQAEIALWQRVEREQAISRVVRTIRQSLDLHTILTAAVTEIAQLLTVDHAAVVQYLPESQCWLHVATYQQNPDRCDNLGLEIPDEGNPFAEQLKRREIVKVVDVAVRANAYSGCEDQG